MSKSKHTKRHNKWDVKSVARVAEYVVAESRSGDAQLIREILKQPSFEIDDKIRENEPALGMIGTIKMIRRVAKLLILLLAVVEVLTSGAALPFLLPLQAELAALVVALAVMGAELKSMRKYVRDVQNIVGENQSSVIDSLPTEEEIDQAVQESDSAIQKLVDLIDKLDVIFD